MRYSLFIIVLVLLLTSCKSKNIDIKNSNALHQELAEINSFEMQKKGVDFYAYGSNPAWRLEVDFEKNFLFAAASLKQELIVKDDDIFKEELDSLVRYKIKGVEGNILVSVKKRKKPFEEGKPYVVNVEFEKKNKKSFYEGLGSYYGSISLHDKWELDELNGKKISGLGLSSIPFIEIHLDKNSVSGFLGCNRFGAKIYFGDKKLVFHHLRSTKMACLNSNIENEFSNAISGKEFEYKLEDKKLVLTGNKEKLIFKKH